MLKGKKVKLRPVGKNDSKKFIHWMNNPDITKYLARSKPITRTMEETWIDSVGQSDTEIVFTIEAIDDEMPVIIGSTGIHKIDWLNRCGEFGIVIGDPKYWENGYGTETAMLLIQYTFESLNLHRVESAAYAFNKRSIALHKKIGFTIEGNRRKAVFKNGKYHDIVTFGFLHKEYQKKIMK